MELRDRIAFSLAATLNTNYHPNDIDRWESRKQFLKYVDRLIEDLGLEKWNDGPYNSMERYMTRWFSKDGS